MLLVINIPTVTADVVYDLSGSISEDGDNKWDSDEYDIYSIKLFAGERLELALSSPGNLELMVCICDGPEDIEDILYDTIYGTGSSDLYLWIDSYSITSGVFVAPFDMYVDLAIYTYDSSNPSSMSYTLYYNKPMGARYHYSDTIETNFDTVISEGEYSFYLFEMRNEYLDIRIKSDDSLGIVICDCTSLEEVQGLIDSNQNSSDSYFYTNQEGVFSTLMQVNGRVNVSLFIFGYESNSASIFYDLYTDISEGDRINDNPSPPPGNSGDGSFFLNLILLGVAIFAIYKIYQYFKRRKKGESQYQANTYQTTYAQSGYQQPQVQQSSQHQQQRPTYHQGYDQQNQTERPWYEQPGNIISSKDSGRSSPPVTDRRDPSPSPLSRFCPNCGAQQVGNFCSDCGSRID